MVQKEELPAFPLVQSDFSSPAYLYDFELTFLSKHVPLILLMVSVAICWTRWLYHKLRPTQRWTVMKRGCQVPSSGDGGCHPKHDDQACQNWCTKAHDGGTKQNQWGLELSMRPDERAYQIIDITQAFWDSDLWDGLRLQKKSFNVLGLIILGVALDKNTFQAAHPSFWRCCFA